MISTNLHAQQIVALLLAHDITDIVISPGSRSGALVHTFVGCGKFNCRNVIDERSAGYFALGLAQALTKPVVLLCSSGTATLNYAPAVAEAYQQGVALIVLTADRPPYWIGQLENQCVNQAGIYQNFTQYHANLPLSTDEKSLWYAARQINEAIRAATTGKFAPVHLNIPFEEPLHKTQKCDLPKMQKIDVVATEIQLTASEKQTLLDVLSHSERIMIIVGQHAPDSTLRENVLAFAQQSGAVVLAESLANVDGDSVVWQIDNVCKSIARQSDNFCPDVLITCGEQVVSKSLKSFLRTNPPNMHYHLSADGALIDTYQCLTHTVTMSPTRFFSQVRLVAEKSNAYRILWRTQQSEVLQQYQQFVEHSSFTDLRVYHTICQAIPCDSVVHWGNSSAVRYGLMNAPAKNTLYFGNRGTSGIDGSLSTAVGYASASEKMNTVVLGDLAFLYDSNALWNHYLNGNLRLIVVNNGGGNIFALVETLAQSPAFKQHFFAEHGVTAEPFANAFGLDYACANDDKSLQGGLTTLYASKREKPVVLEVFTDAELSTQTFQQLIKTLTEEQS